MVTNVNRRVNRDGVQGVKKTRGGNSKVKDIAMLVCGSSWKNRRKVELGEEGRKGRRIS